MICLIITTIYLSEIKENGKFTVSQKKSCQNVCLMAFINKQIEKSNNILSVVGYILHVMHFLCCL